MTQQADTGKAISRIINKVNTQLCKQSVPWRVFSNRCGGYVLIPDSVPQEPEVDGELW
ncbi:MAG: hypothetical protein WCF85_22530 [Rhodospirillaceae bacterium]